MKKYVEKRFVQKENILDSHSFIEHFLVIVGERRPFLETPETTSSKRLFLKNF